MQRQAGTAARMAMIVALALIAAPVAARAQDQTEHVDRTVPLPDNGTLRLRNFSGDVRITAGSGRDVVIKATRKAPRERLDRIKLEITSSGSTVSIEANKREESMRDGDNVVRTDFEIQVPASAELDIDAFSSAVTIAGVNGRQHLKTFSGNITVTGVRSPIEAETFSGKIDLDAVASGSAPEIDAKTFGGDIRARLATDAKGTVRFDSFSGSFESDLPMTMQKTERRRVTADLATGSGGTLKFHTFGGDVRIVK